MSIIPKTINNDLKKERSKGSFPIEEFSRIFHGGSESLKIKRDFEKCMLSDLTEDHSMILYESHAAIYDLGIEQAIGSIQKARKFQKQYYPDNKELVTKIFNTPEVFGAMPAGNPFALNFGMMVDAIRQQGTDEQWEKYGKRAENMEIVGTYAQTEMGHGTFLRGLETRADFDREKDEFILNSPTLTSYKWWPGGMGHTTNYCILVAHLYIDNQPKGIQMFVVQLRDEETHIPLPGIDVGDVGKKLGFYGLNNGFLGLKNVRIPRNQMLMRNAQVHRDGSFHKNPVSVLSYFTMVYIRCLVATSNSLMLAMAATIATRYSAVRRQSPINPSEPEPQIIDHVTQQLKLFPEIAKAFAYRMVSFKLIKLYEKTKLDIAKGDYERLPELHANSCILKALISSDASNGIERLRLSCGGHGYMSSANFQNIHVCSVASVTYEGEYTVLLLQVGRFLIKSWRSLLAGKPLSPSVAYLREVSQLQTFGKWSGTWENMVRALQYAAANKTRKAFKSLDKRIKAGQTEAEAANNTGIEIAQAAELHGRYFIASNFLEDIKSYQQTESPALVKVLENLLEIYLVHTVLQHMTDIMRFITITDDDLSDLQCRLEESLKLIRPNAVAICDGFDFHDRVLDSTLGSYDGNVYERLFEAAKKSPLNKQIVAKSFQTHLKPFMKSNM